MNCAVTCGRVPSRCLVHNKTAFLDEPKQVPPAYTGINITIDLQSRSNTDEEERSNMPNGTVWTGITMSLDKLLELIKQQAGGQKIGKITFTAHAGNQGQVLLGPNDIMNAGEYTQWKQLQAEGKTGDARFKSTDKQVQFLKSLSSMAADGGMTIDFVQCSSGGGAKGQQLISEIYEICGSKVKILMYDAPVGWKGGQPWVGSWFMIWYNGKPGQVKKGGLSLFSPYTPEEIEQIRKGTGHSPFYKY